MHLGYCASAFLKPVTVLCTRSQVAKTANVGIWTGQCFFQSVSQQNTSLYFQFLHVFNSVLKNVLTYIHIYIRVAEVISVFQNNDNFLFSK